MPVCGLLKRENGTYNRRSSNGKRHCVTVDKTFQDLNFNSLVACKQQQQCGDLIPGQTRKRKATRKMTRKTKRTRTRKEGT